MMIDNDKPSLTQPMLIELLVDLTAIGHRTNQRLSQLTVFDGCSTVGLSNTGPSG